MRAPSLLSGTVNDLAPLLNEMAEAISVVNDRQTSIRRAAVRVLPRMPHQLCRFHLLREVPLSVFEAGRHADEGLKMQVRSVRPIGRAVEGRDDAQAGPAWAVPLPCRAWPAAHHTTTLSNRAAPSGRLAAPAWRKHGRFPHPAKPGREPCHDHVKQL